MRQIVVLAGGLATRLHPVTKKIPKSLVQVSGRPFLEHQLELFRKNYIEEVVMCVGHLSQQIIDHFGDGKRHGIRIIYSQEKTRLDTGGAIKNAYRYLDDEFFIIYGDSFLDYDYQKVANYRQQKSKLGLMTVWENNDKIEPSRVRVKGIYIDKYQKDPPPKGARFAEYGLNIFPKSIINTIDKIVFPISEYFDILIKDKQLLAYQVPNRFYEIGGFEGIKQTEQFLKQRKKNEKT